MQVGAEGVDPMNGLTDDLMMLATQTSPTDDGDEDDDGLSTGIIVVIIVAVILTVLVLVIIVAGYLVYRRKHKSMYDISDISKRHSVAEYISDNAVANPSYITVQQVQPSQIQEMVSTEPEPLKGKSSTEEGTDHDAVIEVNINANVDDDEDKDTHL